MICALVFVGTTVRPAVTPQISSPCSSKQFSCFSGECVHLDRRCDLQKDCIDGSDEKDCGKICVSSSNMFMRENMSTSLSSHAVDCIMSSWTAWSSCSVSCGLGSLFRQRDILREALPGGSCGGAQFDSRACFPQACPGLNMHLSHRAGLWLDDYLNLILLAFSCSSRPLVRVGGVVGVWPSLWRRNKTEEQNLLCSSSKEWWAGLWGDDGAKSELQWWTLQ